jgi:hypothetical protein
MRKKSQNMASQVIRTEDIQDVPSQKLRSNKDEHRRTRYTCTLYLSRFNFTSVF